MTVAAFHQCFKNREATEHAVKSFREHNDGPYTLISDGGDDFSDIAKKYNCYYYHSKWNLGYRDHNHPSGIYGWTKEETLEWLKRFHLSCTIEKSDHIIMMEDDVYVMAQLDLEEDVEFCGFDSPGNHLKPRIVDYLTDKYDAKFQHSWYGTPGGSIFKTETFVENYDKITEIIGAEFDHIKANLCAGIGYPDVLMTVYYYLCGKPYTVNPFFTETTRNSNWNNGNYAIVHQFKKYYKQS